MMLPAETDDQGNLQFVDPLLREAAELADVSVNLGKQALATTSQNNDADWEASASYLPMSFQGSVNWNRNPHLVRMIPDPENAEGGYRRPATSEDLEELSKNPVCNLVVLVHGHNEEGMTLAA